MFLVATANAVQELPAELLRKGRFDEIFFVDLPSAAVRAEIFALHLARRKLDPASFDLPALATASEGFSGAEIEQAIVSALYDAAGNGARAGSGDPAQGAGAHPAAVGADGRAGGGAMRVGRGEMCGGGLSGGAGR